MQPWCNVIRSAYLYQLAISYTYKLDFAAPINVINTSHTSHFLLIRDFFSRIYIIGFFISTETQLKHRFDPEFSQCSRLNLWKTVCRYPSRVPALRFDFQNGTFRTATPHVHDDLPGVIVLHYCNHHSMRITRLRCFLFPLVLQHMCWTLSNPGMEKGFVLQVNYMVSVTKQS